MRIEKTPSDVPGLWCVIDEKDPSKTNLCYLDKPDDPVASGFSSCDEARDWARIHGLRANGDTRRPFSALSEHAQAAEMIRFELRKAFPGVRFSIKSQSYSGGSSIDVKYMDGPAPSAVEAIVGRYQEGHFDASRDIYEYSNKNQDLPQVKYTFVSREWTPETFARLVAETRGKYGIEEKDPNASFNWGGRWTTIREMIWREHREDDLMPVKSAAGVTA